MRKMHSPVFKWKSGYKYRTVSPMMFSSNIYPFDDVQLGRITLLVNGALFVDSGYSYDGPSGPTIDTKNFMRGSLFHDAIYELQRAELIAGKCSVINPGFVRKGEGKVYSRCQDMEVATHDRVRTEADQGLIDICLSRGMSILRAMVVYDALRLFGAKASSEKKEVYTD